VDIGTLIGTLALIGAVVFAGHQGFQALYSPEAIALVVVGTVAWALISYPLKTVLGIGQLYKNTFFYKTSDPHALIRKMVAYAETARREGILALEKAADQEEDTFLAQGVRLAVDGIEPTLIMNILETELRILNERHRIGQDMLFNMGETAPSLGMIGTLIGLILMLRDLSDPSMIGPGMALALVTTLYGAILANVVYKPFSEKLRNLNNHEMMMKRMVVEGIMAIQSGDNPRIVEHKLMVFLPPKHRRAAE
jgi:chemotaxis protein MotA